MPVSPSELKKMTTTLARQQTRSADTQHALMHAAEKLIADKGVENVSIREIVKAAGQKNESALQYHFKNVQGLFIAIQQNRDQQTRDKRAQMLEELLARNANPSLREICSLMTAPAFLLAKASTEYRRYVMAFSHKLALSHNSALSRVNKSGGGGESGQKIGMLLRAALPHLDENAYRQRMDCAVRLTSVSMGNHAAQKKAFKGAHAELFLNSLIDATVGILSAPVSPETKAIVKSIKLKKS